MSETRDVSVNGMMLVDLDGRWRLLRASGERPQAGVQVRVWSTPSRDGAVPLAGRRPLQAAEMRLDVLFTCPPGSLPGVGGREAYDEALAEFTRALRLGEVSVIGMVLGGVECFQKCVITALGGAVEHAPGYVQRSYLAHLLDGVWVSEAETRRAYSGAVECISGGSAPASHVAWRVPGPCTGFSVDNDGRRVLEWAGNVPRGRALVVQGWKSWSVDENASDWWVEPETVSTVEVSDFAPLMPGLDGDYAVEVRVNGALQSKDSTRVLARGGVAFI